jgi:hypothetical protein
MLFGQFRKYKILIKIIKTFDCENICVNGHSYYSLPHDFLYQINHSMSVHETYSVLHFLTFGCDTISQA